MPLTRVRVEGHDEIVLGDGWQAAACQPDAHTDATALDGLTWLPARVPGTAAGALHDAGRWRPGDPCDLDLDAQDWWWRTSFDAQSVAAGEEVHLCLDGIATVAEVYLNGELVLESDSMFAVHALDVTAQLSERNELAIRCRALAPLLRERRKPRARWRTRLVYDGNLRFFRTMLLGRLPGIAPGPAAVGPWRAVRLERTESAMSRSSRCAPASRATTACCRCWRSMRALERTEVSAVEIELSGPSGAHSATLLLDAAHDSDPSTKDPSESRLTVRGELRVPGVARWWPHTHGEPALHDVVVHLVGERETARRSRSRSTPGGSAFGLSRLEQRRITTSNRTGWTCTSTASACSLAGRCGRRSTRSGWPRRRTSCARN